MPFQPSPQTLPDPRSTPSASELSNETLLQWMTADVSGTADPRKGLRPPRIQGETGTNSTRTFLDAFKALLKDYNEDTATLELADKCYHLAGLCEAAGNRVWAQGLYTESDAQRGRLGASHPSRTLDTTASPELRAQADELAWKQLLDGSGSGVSKAFVDGMRKRYAEACAKHEAARARWENGHATCHAVVEWAKAELAAEFPDSTIASSAEDGEVTETVPE